MAYYLFPPPGQSARIAPSLGGGEEPGNPTILPLEILRRFHFTFLIRHPRRSIPSYYRCVIPPLNKVTGWNDFMASEAGYEELVRLFDFLLDNGIVDKDHLTVVDADDLLDKPEAMIKLYCHRTGIDFDPKMLVWDQADKEHAARLFAKWNGFHNDVLDSDKLNGRSHAQVSASRPPPSVHGRVASNRLRAENVDGRVGEQRVVRKVRARGAKAHSRRRRRQHPALRVPEAILPAGLMGPAHRTRSGKRCAATTATTAKATHKNKKDKSQPHAEKKNWEKKKALARAKTPGKRRDSDTGVPSRLLLWLGKRICKPGERTARVYVVQCDSRAAV